MLRPKFITAEGVQTYEPRMNGFEDMLDFRGGRPEIGGLAGLVGL